MRFGIVVERRPQVVDGVRPPRRPAVGIDVTERARGVDDTEIGAEHHVGMAEAAHEDVVGRPRADPAELEQSGPGVFWVGTHVERHVAFGDGVCGTPDRGAPGHGIRERVVGRRSDGIGTREHTLESVPFVDHGAWDLDADGVDEVPGDGACAGNRDLLADDRPNERLERIDAARRSATGHRSDERAERWIGARCSVDRFGVGIEVEQPSYSLDGGREIRPVLDAQLSLDVIGLIGCDVSDTAPKPAGSVSVRRYRGTPSTMSNVSTPGIARRPRNARTAAPANGRRVGSRSDTVTAPGSPAGAGSERRR